jgi:hypothetical protein
MDLMRTPGPGCPKCDSGWIYVEDHVVGSYPYTQVTACPRCLPQHINTRRDNEPQQPDTRRDLD